MDWRRVADVIRRASSPEDGALPRNLVGFPGWLFRAGCIIFASFYLYLAGPHFLGTPSVGWQRGLFLLIISILAIMRFPASARSPRDRPSLMDWVLIAACIVTFGFWIADFKNLVHRAGSPLTVDFALGTLAILISLEVVRRAMGPILMWLGVFFITYALAGPWIPGPFSHAGVSVKQLSAYMYTLEGIFGVVADINATYVTLFIIFGALLNAFGAGKFFVEFPYALTAGMRGGPAKTAVLASGLFGMISGSATANTMATGTFTIPLMKRAGYKPHIAGAIEPAASTGGMFMPPVMGAGAFLMAEFLEIPYSRIALVSVVPAIIYFLSVAYFCHLEALRTNIPIVPKDQRADAWALFRDGWFYLAPVALIVVLLIIGTPVSRGVYWTIVTTIALDLWRRFRQRGSKPAGEILRATGRDFVEGLASGARDTLTIGSVSGTIGGVIAIIFLTGLGFTLASSLSVLTGGSIPLAILMAFIVSYILGMGMTVTTAYILVAVLFAPALIRMGVDPMAAHLLLFWYSQTSNVSPPVCLAAFAGAAIAKSDPYQTGFAAFKYASFIVILPIMFVYTPILMPEGFTPWVGWSMLTAIAAVFPYAAAMTGFFRRPTTTTERVLLFVATAFMLVSELYTDLIGIAITLAIYFWQGRRASAADPARDVVHG